MSGEQLMALLGLPLKHRLPRQGWREVLSCIHCNAPIKTLGNGKKINSLCSSCFEAFVQAQGSWKWVPFQGSSVFRYWSPPVLQAASCFCGSSDITDTAQRPPTVTSAFAQFPWFTSHGHHGLHGNKSSVSACFLCFLFPLFIMYKETAKNKYQVRIYTSKYNF